MKAPFQAHSDTSRLAAAEAEPKMGSMHRKIRAYLVNRGPTGATDEEIATDLGIHASTERPRRVELQRLGMCKDSGKRRKTEGRHDAVVWIACNQRPPERRPDARNGRLAAAKLAMEPFAAQAANLLENDHIIRRGADSTVFLVQFKCSLAQLRALVESWEA